MLILNAKLKLETFSLARKNIQKRILNLQVSKLLSNINHFVGIGIVNWPMSQTCW